MRHTTRPLSVRHIAIVRRLVESSRHTPDLLFIAADAYDEFARELDLDDCVVAAVEAKLLAERLRAAAQQPPILPALDPLDQPLPSMKRSS